MDVQYIDSGARHPDQALGGWLQKQLTADISELRCQSGFFSADGLAPFAATIKTLSASDSLVNILIGSNDGDTLEGDVAELVALLALPRANGRLGVVSFGGAYFHPKTYHLRRADGSQAAYVGSANLTLAGLTALHVEAGLLLDTRDGDASKVLEVIASSIDDWFAQSRVGMELVNSSADLSRLTALGVLSKTPPPRPARPSTSTGTNPPARPRLAPLVRFPGFTRIAPRAPPSAPTGAGGSTTTVAAPPAAPRPPSPLQSVPSPQYPGYVLFAPGLRTPTSGASALSGSTLPAGAQGLIIRLSKDSSRHWQGGTGTANISVPTATVQTLRFGLSSSNRPRAVLEIEMRYLSPPTFDFRAAPEMTSVQVYGHTAGDTGHGDVRLVVPKPPARTLSNSIARNRLSRPNSGNMAFLEWPSVRLPRFRLTLLDSNSALHAQALSIFSTSGKVGGGACWLPAGLSPTW